MGRDTPGRERSEEEKAVASVRLNEAQANYHREELARAKRHLRAAEDNLAEVTGEPVNRAAMPWTEQLAETVGGLVRGDYVLRVEPVDEPQSEGTILGIIDGLRFVLIGAPQA